MKRMRNELTISDNCNNRGLGWVPPSVALSLRDKADGISISRDQLICKGPPPPGGFRMVRATHGANHGSYFWETEILIPSSQPAHVRIGWSTSKGELLGPVGYDKFSYSYRDVNGSKVHDSIRQDNYGEQFGPGDVIGCLLVLDDFNPSLNIMRFFKNGVDQGVAFKGKDITSGIYFPAISLFQEAIVRVNFGPTFLCKYDLSVRFNPMSELQPMCPADRKLHDATIARIKRTKFNDITFPGSVTSSPSLQTFSYNREIFSVVALSLDVALSQHEEFLKRT